MAVSSRRQWAAGHKCRPAALPASHAWVLRVPRDREGPCQDGLLRGSCVQCHLHICTLAEQGLSSLLGEVPGGCLQLHDDHSVHL